MPDRSSQLTDMKILIYLLNFKGFCSQSINDTSFQEGFYKVVAFYLEIKDIACTTYQLYAYTS